MYKLTVTVVAIMLLTGCTNLRLRTPLVVSGPQAAADCGDLLGYYEDLSRMSSKRFKQERIATTKIVSMFPDSCNQLRLALTLSQSGKHEKDRKKAQKLLTALLEGKNNLSKQSRQLAVLLNDQLDQQQSLQLRINNLQDSLKQERSTSQRQLKQLSDMQSQLQQLKNIEENINEKEQAIITPATKNVPHEPVQNPTGR